MTVPGEEATANYVPAAAVTRRWRALFGFTGRKGSAGALQARREIPGLNPGRAAGTGGLECAMGRRNTRCSGGMRGYLVEHRWRRRSAGASLTLRDESVGSKQD